MQKIKVVGEEVLQVEKTPFIDLAEIEKKLTKARTKLILEKPFLGNLVLRLPLVVADRWCKTVATDAKNFYYNANFIATLSPEQIAFVLVHEALHCALRHFARRAHRAKHRWDLACDFAINPLLIKEGFRPPLDVLIFREYEGMIAEEIYPMIADKLDSDLVDEHLYDANSDKSDEKGLREDNLYQKTTWHKVEKKHQKHNQNTSNNNQNIQNENTQILAAKPKPLSPSEIEELAKAWQKHLASSAQLAKQSGRLEGEIAKLVDFFLAPQISWRALLAHYISAKAKDDFSYYRPAKREGEAILPSLRSDYVNIAVAIDTSGSISQKEIDEFISEIDAIKAAMRASITLFACDNKLAKKFPLYFEAWQGIDFPKSLGGGGGTNFNPVFDYLNTQDINIDSLIYFTDALGIFPKNEPPYPVVWLIKGKEDVPFGRRIQLN